MRFKNKNALTAWEGHSSNTYLDISFEGEPQYENMWYIDLPANSEYDYMGVVTRGIVSYIKIFNDENNLETYYAFIDRVEKNAIDATIRLYYTIDYWTTILGGDYGGTETPTIYCTGDVIRAHVNDIENTHPTLKNTTNEMEVMPSMLEWEVLTRQPDNHAISDYEYPLNSGNVRFMHFMCNASIFDSGSLSQIRGSKCLFYEVVIPISPEFDSMIIEYGEEQYIPFSPRDIKYDSVSGVYVTPYISDSMTYSASGDGSTHPEFHIAELGDYTFVALTESGKGMFGCDKLLVFVGATYPQPDKPVITYYPNVFKWTSDDLANLGINTGSYSFSIPSGYDDYKKQVIKFYSEAYCPLYVDCGADKHDFRYTQIVGDDAFTIKFNSNPCVIIEDYSLYRRLAPIDVIPFTILQPNPTTDSYWDRYTAQISATKNKFGIVGGALNMASGIAESFTKQASAFDVAESVVSSAQNIAVNAMSLVYNEALANGTGVRMNANTDILSQMVGLGLPVVTYIKCNDEDVLRNLILYGYNTHLQLDKVLDDSNARKYFNFVRTEDCVIFGLKDTQGHFIPFNAQARNYIKYMFDNGVWLFDFVDWDNLFDFDVPNYCVHGYEEGQ